MAEKYNLVITGGSDYHGTNKRYIDLGTGKGKLFIPSSILSSILEYKKD
jgi:hypothetical protein